MERRGFLGALAALFAAPMMAFKSKKEESPSNIDLNGKYVFNQELLKKRHAELTTADIELHGALRETQMNWLRYKNATNYKELNWELKRVAPKMRKALDDLVVTGRTEIKFPLK